MNLGFPVCCWMFMLLFSITFLWPMMGHLCHQQHIKISTNAYQVPAMHLLKYKWQRVRGGENKWIITHFPTWIQIKEQAHMHTLLNKRFYTETLAPSSSCIVSCFIFIFVPFLNVWTFCTSATDVESLIICFCLLWPEPE